MYQPIPARRPEIDITNKKKEHVLVDLDPG